MELIELVGTKSADLESALTTIPKLELDCVGQIDGYVASGY